MKLVLISDTHNATPYVPDGDILIHAGDLTGNGTVAELGKALVWLGSLPHQHKIVIAGNHDFCCEELMGIISKWMAQYNLIYLLDSGIEINGLNFWGSPYQPWFYDWAFNEHRGHQIRHHWDMIPDNTDILITHGPPYEILDETAHGERVGCVDLLNTITRIKPKLHVFGHIHEAYGKRIVDNTTFCNASIMSVNYQPINKPIVIDI